MVAMKEMRPESSTMEMEMPSAPTKYSTLKSRIQTALATSCTPPSFGSYIIQAAMAAAIDRKLVTSAIQRLDWSTRALPSPSVARPIISSTMIAAPMSGKKVAQLRTFPSVKGFIGAGSLGRADQEVDEDHHQGAAEGAVEVGLDAAGLQEAQRTAGPPDDVGDPVDRAVDQVLVDGAGEVGEHPGDGPHGVHQAVEYPAVEPGERPGHKGEGAEHHRRVELVHVVLVVDDRPDALP